MIYGPLFAAFMVGGVGGAGGPWGARRWEEMDLGEDRGR